jgi:hypothetical protein
VIAHEPEPFAGIAFVSRANQAAAFEDLPLRPELAVLSSQAVEFSRSAVVSGRVAQHKRVARAQ